MPRNGKVIPSDNPIAQEMMHQTGLGLHEIAWRHNGARGSIRQAKKNVEAIIDLISASDASQELALEAWEALDKLHDSLAKRKDQL